LTPVLSGGPIAETNPIGLARPYRLAELAGGETSMTAANDLAIRRALEAAGVEFIDENGGSPGVRLRNREKLRRPK
jgi:hypothetical protein